MLFCQVWIARRTSTSNLTKPQTFPLEKPHGSNSGLRSSLLFWMILYDDYLCRWRCQVEVKSIKLNASKNAVKY